MKTALPRDTDVVIIGAGPVGLTASLLLDQWRIAHVVIEAQDPPSDHPQAYFISARSMQIFRELELEEKIRAAAAPLDELCRHIYATRLIEGRIGQSPHGATPHALLGEIDHFPTGPDHRVSPSWECNLSQPLLQDLLRSAVAKRRDGRLLMGWRADLSEKQAAVDVLLRPAAGGRTHRLRCQYVICADGAHSASRERLGIGRIQQTPTLQHLLNIHFFSPTLAELLRRRPSGFCRCGFRIRTWVLSTVAGGGRRFLVRIILLKPAGLSSPPGGPVPGCLISGCAKPASMRIRQYRRSIWPALPGAGTGHRSMFS